MQLATDHIGQPWICTVYYVLDDELNLYWLSWPNRRHSLEIVSNNKVAITVPIKFDVPVIGVQAEGMASKVTEASQVEAVMKKYVKKYNSGKNFYTNFLAGNNQHEMYKFTPRIYQLFDEVNFTENEPQTIVI